MVKALLDIQTRDTARRRAFGPQQCPLGRSEVCGSRRPPKFTRENNSTTNLLILTYTTRIVAAVDESLAGSLHMLRARLCWMRVGLT